MYLLVTLFPLFLLQSVNMQTDWKIITVFVGGNDLCDFCKDQVRDTRLHAPPTSDIFSLPQATYSAANYATHIKNVLDLIKANVCCVLAMYVTVCVDGWSVYVCMYIAVCSVDGCVCMCVCM